MTICGRELKRARQICRTLRFVVVVVEVDLENRGCGMVESESLLDSTRRVVESWVFAKRGIVRLSASDGWNVIWKRLRRGCDCLAVAWRLKVGCGWVVVPDGWRRVGKRLLDGWGNGCAMFELSESRASRPLRGLCPCGASAWRR